MNLLSYDYILSLYLIQNKLRNQSNHLFILFIFFYKFRFIIVVGYSSDDLLKYLMVRD